MTFGADTPELAESVLDNHQAHLDSQRRGNLLSAIILAACASAVILVVAAMYVHVMWRLVEWAWGISG